ncbi:hypothetical protein LOTGIDRAFT_176569 [Lottia gigantea]|uniref:Uncharacterized protein n=1 Tax=Lottia gigantea TaxID=225164 RepID=V4ASG8_LOTGI|nr:hypothetical protein LOTGIDRAFT_176569 [Lottia gigantea]ESO96676.1 hypothetical protein LOTGIDRAFT_176569 [Lottia gigantea]
MLPETRITVLSKAPEDLTTLKEALLPSKKISAIPKTTTAATALDAKAISDIASKAAEEATALALKTLDFMKQYNVQIDIGQGIVNLQDRLAEVMLITQDIGFVRSTKSIKIKAKSHAEIPVRISKTPQDITALLEPSKFLKNLNLLGAKRLVKIKAIYQLLNPTNVEIRIPNRAILATAQKIDDNTKTVDINDNESSLNNVNIMSTSTSTNDNNKLDFDLSDSDLSNEEKDKLITFLNNHRSVFATNLKELGTTNRYEHYIDTGDNKSECLITDKILKRTK